MDKDATVLEDSRQMSAADAEDYLLTMERSRRFRETRMGVSLEKAEKWMDERRSDPNAPCPPVEYTPSR